MTTIMKTLTHTRLLGALHHIVEHADHLAEPAHIGPLHFAALTVGTLLASRHH